MNFDISPDDYINYMSAKLRRDAPIPSKKEMEDYNASLRYSYDLGFNIDEFYPAHNKNN